MSAQRIELLFLDSKVENFPDRAPGVEVHRLDDASNGLAQIAGLLAGRRDIDALHVISHGAEASIHLGEGQVTADVLQARAGELARIGAALKPGGDILIYGCEVGAGDAGAAFVEALRAATGANIAASTGLTGAARLGGDWALARTSGAVATRTLRFADYDGVLPSVAGTVTPAVGNNGLLTGPMFTDGEGGSTDIPGIDYNFYFADQFDNTASDIAIFERTPGITTYTTIINSEADSAIKFVIESGGGEDFKLTSFFTHDTDQQDGTWTITGYRDGSPVGMPMDYTIDQTGEYARAVNLSPDFQNIDMAVITRMGGSTDGFMWAAAFSDFVFADPVIPDVTPPTVGIVVADDNLLAGETSAVTFTFSEAVTGFDNTDVAVANGTLSTVASLDGGITWTATLTPNTGVTDATNVVTVTMTGVVDAASNPGFGATDSNNYAVATVRPTATVLVGDNSLTDGETSLVTITFSEAVTGFNISDMTADNGELSALTTGDGGVTWTATLTPDLGVTDDTNVVRLDNTDVANAAGNAGTGTTDSNNYAVGVSAPTATIDVADATLKIGETSLVTITFSEAVTDFDNADLTIDNGMLTNVFSEDFGVTWTATLTPTAAITAATNLISLDNTGLTSMADNNAGVGTTDSNNYAIDGVQPTASIVVADASLGSGETSLVTITFSEAVTGFDNTDLTVDNGTLSNVSSSNGGVTWTATLTPTASIIDATNLITVDKAGVADTAGNAGTGTTDSNNYAVDTTAAPPTPEPDTPTEIPGSIDADTIAGNDADNRIDAGAGADSVSGGVGADALQGGAGDDMLQGNVGSDSLVGGEGGDIVLGGQGEDFLQGNVGADLMAGDKGSDTVHGGQDNDSVQGGLDNDYVSGDNGDDVVRGGQGDDMVLGGDGADFVSGDRGSDTLIGGAGSDTFYSFAGAGIDRILGFNLAEGDRIVLEPGTTYALSQQGADVVIDMNTSQMILTNVQLSSLTGDWIFNG